MKAALALTALLAVATASAPARADELAPPDPPAAACDPIAEVGQAALEREHAAARRWNVAWTITYTAFAGLQVGAALAEFSPGSDFTIATRDSLYIGAGKAAIGALSRVILPLRVPVPPRAAGGCADPAAIAIARRTAARKERNTFWLQLGGGAALHLVGGGYLVVHRDAWKEALVSLAMGAVVSTITLYTEPKTSWRHPVTVLPTVSSDGAGLAIVGAF